MPACPIQMQALFLAGNGVGVNHPLGYLLVATPAGQVVTLPLSCNNETNGAVR